MVNLHDEMAKSLGGYTHVSTSDTTESVVSEKQYDVGFTTDDEDDTSWTDDSERDQTVCCWYSAAISIVIAAFISIVSIIFVAHCIAERASYLRGGVTSGSAPLTQLSQMQPFPQTPLPPSFLPDTVTVPVFNDINAVNLALPTKEIRALSRRNWDGYHYDALQVGARNLALFSSSYEFAKYWPVRVTTGETYVKLSIHAVRIFALMSDPVQIGEIFLKQSLPQTICSMFMSQFTLTVTVFDRSTGASWKIIKAWNNQFDTGTPEVTQKLIEGAQAECNEYLMYGSGSRILRANKEINQWFDLRWIEFLLPNLLPSATLSFTLVLDDGSRKMQWLDGKLLSWGTWPYHSPSASAAVCTTLTAMMIRTHPLLIVLNNNMENLPHFNVSLSFHSELSRFKGEMQYFYGDPLDKDNIEERERCSMHFTVRPSSSMTNFQRLRTAHQHYADLLYANDLPLPPFNDDSSIPMSDRWESATQKMKRKQLPFERAEDPNVCSPSLMQWLTEYIDWSNGIHRATHSSPMSFSDQRAIANKLGVKYWDLVTEDTGHSDRVIGIVSGTLMAMLKKRLLFHADDLHKWPEMIRLYSFALELQQPTTAEWMLRPGTMELTYEFKWRERKNAEYFEIRPDLGVMKNDYTIIRIKSPRGYVSWILKDTNYREFFSAKNASVVNLYGCLQQNIVMPHLNVLMDNHGDIATAYSSLLRPDYDSLTLQIRTGDKQFRLDQTDRFSAPVASNIDPFIGFYDCTRDMAITYHNESYSTNKRFGTVVYLATDDVPMKLSALYAWGPLALQRQTMLGRQLLNMQMPLEGMLPTTEQSYLNLIKTQSISQPFLMVSSLIKPVHININGQTSWMDGFRTHRITLLELYLQSLGEVHVITHESNYGRIPMYASLQLRAVAVLSANEINDKISKDLRCKGPIQKYRPGYNEWTKAELDDTQKQQTTVDYLKGPIHSGGIISLLECGDQRGRT